MIRFDIYLVVSTKFRAKNKIRKKSVKEKMEGMPKFELRPSDSWQIYQWNIIYQVARMWTLMGKSLGSRIST